MSPKERFLLERKIVMRQWIKEAEEKIDYAKEIGYPTPGLKRQIQTWKQELKKRPNPTSLWLKKNAN